MRERSPFANLNFKLSHYPILQFLDRCMELLKQGLGFDDSGVVADPVWDRVEAFATNRKPSASFFDPQTPKSRKIWLGVLFAKASPDISKAELEANRAGR